ncbi:hypothetical protein [Pontiella sulfatireligans]|uniref:Uncharacterized protein n=1 Tax=Pontiella sulfatireligans TaxID=2750658 RepID=A0A6C2URP2_9BACT|nr:hypothetical protein [Pontiella sulfatireligans]VGO22623.1 hypothetical protein SCARR_04708 [Pontiella sulfatireligans]
MPHTPYHYRGQGTNAEGTTDGEDIIFTTPYDYAAWVAEQFGTNASNPEIAGPWTDAEVVGIMPNPDGTETVAVRSTSAVSLEPIQFMKLRISMQ